MSTLKEAGGSALSSPDSHFRRAQLPVHGLMCVADKIRLEHFLGQVAGVLEAQVNPVTEIAYIAYDPLLISRGELMAAIVQAGFRNGYWRESV